MGCLRRVLVQPAANAQGGWLVQVVGPPMAPRLQATGRDAGRPDQLRGVAAACMQCNHPVWVTAADQRPCRLSPGPVVQAACPVLEGKRVLGGGGLDGIRQLHGSPQSRQIVPHYSGVILFVNREQAAPGCKESMPTHPASPCPSRRSSQSPCAAPGSGCRGRAHGEEPPPECYSCLISSAGLQGSPAGAAPA